MAILISHTTIANEVVKNKNSNKTECCEREIKIKEVFFFISFSECVHEIAKQTDN